MKILHYIGTFSTPSETFVYDLINNLEENNMDNYILSHRRILEFERPFSKVKVISENVSLIKKIYCKLFYKQWQIRNDISIVEYIKKLNPDIIHAHFGQNGVRMYNLIKKYNLDIRLIISMHGTDTTMYPLKYKKYKNNIKQFCENTQVTFTFPSNFLKLEFQKNIEINNNENQVLLPNSFNKIFYNIKNRSLDASLTLKLISTGRLIHWKGFEYLIDGMKELEKKFPNFELKIIGDGSEMMNLKEQVEKHSLQDKVKLIGRIEHKEIATLLYQSDIYIQPSIVDINTNQTESFGISIIEAIVSGLPVIATNVGGIPDTVLGGDEKYAKLILPNSPKQIASAIIEMINNYQDNSEFRKKIKDTYSQSKQIENILKIYTLKNKKIQ